MKDRQFYDLTKLASDRTRQAAQSVMQLLDDDHERVALLMAVANDFIHGAAQYLHESEDPEPMSKEDALSAVLYMLVNSLGKDTLINALQNGKNLVTFREVKL
jgi:hypothetical protein